MTVVAVIKYVTVPPHSFISKDFYRPQTKFGQGNIFTGVSLSGGWLTSMLHRSHDWGVCLLGSASRGGGICIQGDEGLHPGGWAVPPSHVCLWAGGQADALLSTPKNTWDTTGYGQQAGDTHPTGMYSCLYFSLKLLKSLKCKCQLIFWLIKISLAVSVYSFWDLYKSDIFGAVEPGFM